MEKTQGVQDLKSERVQKELALVVEEPFRISLKAERVQKPSALAVEPVAQWVSAISLDLELSKMQPVTISLTGQGAFITI